MPRKPKASSASLTVTPNPATVGDTLTITTAGIGKGAGYFVRFMSPEATGYLTATDGSQPLPVWAPGTWRLDLLTNGDVLASVTVEVGT